jgi:hypothetical protein
MFMLCQHLKSPFIIVSSFYKENRLMGVWKVIRRGWEDFSSLTRFEVGVLALRLVYGMTYGGRAALKGEYPELFSIACIWYASVANMQFSNGFP